jgi:AraC family transcriptional regulator
MRDSTANFYRDAVQRALQIITGHMDEALDLEGLAKAACLSPFHFHRVFKGMIGETPLELHRRLRLERAAHQLCYTDSSIGEIAYAAGYDAHEPFTRAFHEGYGMNPTAFRKKEGVAAPACAPQPGRGPKTELAAICRIHFPITEPVENLIPKGDQTMDVQIQTYPEIRVATVRHVGPYNRISEAFGKLGEMAGRHGLIKPGAMMIAVYLDDPETTPTAQLRSDAAISLTAGDALPEGMGELRLPAGSYAVTLHRGSYAKLGDSWLRFMGQWLPQSGRRMGAGFAIEVYLNHPGNAAEGDLRTELRIPIV